MHVDLSKTLVFDGSYLLHRALHVKSLYALRAPDGTGTGGVYQTLRSINMEMGRFPDHLPIVCWDGGLSARRLAAYPEYKERDGRRKGPVPPKGHGWSDPDREYDREYLSQRGWVIEVLRLFGVPSVAFDGWEGDDLVYILAKSLDDVVVVSDDRDLVQLLSPTVRVRRPGKGETLTYEGWQADHDDPGMRRFVIEKAIVGDPSDNIPPCAKGVGPATARALSDVIIKYPDWKLIVENSDDRRVRAFGNQAAYDRFEVNMELIDLSRVEVPDGMVSDIAAVISSSLSMPDFMGALGVLSRLGVHDPGSSELATKMSALVDRKVTT